MSEIPSFEKKTSFSEKFSRLRLRFRTEWRKFGGTLLAGKCWEWELSYWIMACGPGLVSVMSTRLDPDLKGMNIVNPVNTAWTLVAAFWYSECKWFTMLEAGFCRSRSRERARRMRC